MPLIGTDYLFGMYSIALLMAAGVAAFVAGLVWSRRSTPGAFPLYMLELASFVWCVAIIFEHAATTVPLKLLWSQLAYLGTMTCPVFFFLFTYEYAQLRHKASLRLMFLLLSGSLFAIVAAFTNQYHHLLWTHITIPEGTHVAVYGHGPIFWLVFAYCWILLLAGFYLLFRNRFAFAPLRMQNTVFVVGASIPLFSNIIYVLHLNPFTTQDMTPAAFVFSGAALGYGLLGTGLFTFIPIARDKLVESMSEAVIVVDSTRQIIDVNPAAATLFMQNRKDLLGHSASAIFADWPELLDDSITRTTLLELTLGKDSYCEVQVTPLTTKRGGSTGRLFIFRDITLQKQAEQKLMKLATIDALTGIPNRSHFMSLSRKELLRTERYEYPLTAMMFDVDHFKSVNDTYGHDVGDTVLRTLAKTIGATLRNSDIFGRIGGEEFGIILPGTGLKTAQGVAERIRRETEACTFTSNDGHTFSITLSIGIAPFAPDNPTLRYLLIQADTALYQAKENGRNQVVVLEAD